MPRTLEEEKVLIEKVISGDKSAEFELYNELQPKVYWKCLQMLKDADQAEEIAQITMISIFSKLPNFLFNARVSTWAYQIAVNQCLMSFRNKKAKVTDSLADHDHLPELASAHSFSVPDKILLERALKELPDGYRKVFFLHDVEGFEHGEIARILNLSVGTSKSQLHKARAKMRRLINKKVNPKVYERAF